jgi:transcriptional regulator with XRE-family HTH domain
VQGLRTNRKGSILGPVEILAQRIRALRTERGLSSERLARLVDVSNKSIVTWEKDRGDPSLANLLALAEVFGVSPDYLLGLTPRSGAGDELDPAGESSGAVYEAAVEGDARRADRRRKRTRRGPTSQPGS